MMPAKTKKELRAEKKALRRAAHLRAMQDHESEESNEENYRRTADPPAYVATNEGDIVAAPKSPRAEKMSPGADGEGEVAAIEKKPQIRGILKKPTLPRGAVARDSVEVSSSSSDTDDDEEGGKLARKPSLSLESVETGASSAYSEPGMSTATMSATTASGAASVISAATSSADTVSQADASASTEVVKNRSVKGKSRTAGASAVATIEEGIGNDGEGKGMEGGEEAADLGSNAVWDDAIEKKEEERAEKKLAAVDGSDRSRKIKGSIDGSKRSGKAGRSDVSGTGKSKSTEEGREKMGSKRGSKKKSKSKKSKRDLDAGGGNGEVATAAVIAHADEAVQNWKESSDPIMHGEDGGSKSHTRGALEGDEAEGKREKQKKRLLMLSVCLLLLLVLILGLAFGMRSGGDDGGSNVEEANDVDAKGTGTSTRSPSRSPTTEPTPPGMWIFDTPVDVVDVPSPSARKETVHSVDLVLENMPKGYTLPPEMENSILSFVRDKIDRQLSEDDIELISVFYAEDDVGERRFLRAPLVRRRLATISLPLEISVVGPADISDVHLTYIMEALEDTTDLTEYLQLLDKNAFRDADVSFASDSYERPTPTPQPTNDPTPPPIFRSPTASPIENIGGTTPSPTTAPLINLPTPPPTPLATTASPTDNPTFKPTWVNSLKCTPDPPPNAQCDEAEMILLEKCSSSDTRAKDEYAHALAMATKPDGIIYGVVGSPRHDTSGSAYLISYDQATTQWKHVVEIVPGGASANGGFEGEEVNRSYDQFGYAVALSSEWIAVSAPFDTASTGRVSVYWLDGVLSGGFTEPDAELLASDGNFLARFGSSLAIDRNTLVIGANKDRGNLGSAYIFQYSDGARSWLEIAKLAPDDVSVDSQGNFGQSVAITLGVVVVGAPMDGTIGRRRSGSVYVYDDTGAFLQKIVPFELLGGDQFGYSVAAQTSTNPLTNARETRIAIGARMRDDQGIDSGSVYLYVQRDGEGDFVFEEKLTPSEWATGAEMGTSLAMDEDKIIVGARSLNSGGGAFYFQYDGLAWSGRDSVTPQSVGARSGDEVGSAVAMASGVALIGAHSNDEGGQDAGALYSFVVCD
ncbi:hypothetical protein ACHAXT_002754 [Thalassiosira profunda]